VTLGGLQVFDIGFPRGSRVSSAQLTKAVGTADGIAIDVEKTQIDG